MDRDSGQSIYNQVQLVWLAKRLRSIHCLCKRNMTAFLIDTTMRLLALLPLWMNQAVGRLIGRIAWWTNSSDASPGT